MQIMADIGGIPGKDCNGFCKYCYFKKVKEIEALGCKFCPPGKFGCFECTEGVADRKTGFKDPFVVIGELQSTLMFSTSRGRKVNISGGGDVSCYPHLIDLSSNIKQLNLPIHLGYTSGKGFADSEAASKLINNGVNEVTFTLFSVDEKIRKEWIRDKNPKVSLESAKIFAENTEFHAASVIIPGINDGKVLEDTCNKLEEWGAEALILMRFANYKNQGLILGEEPLIEGQKTHSVEEFEDLVKEINKEYQFRVTGTPVCDPENKTPFALDDEENFPFLEIITKVTGEATILTSKIAGPKIRSIFEKIGAGDKVNVVTANQDIACLITTNDLYDLDLNELKNTVILPGRSYIHEETAKKILSEDGKNRMIIRGPDQLTADGEMSTSYKEEEILELEIRAFRELVSAINFFGYVKD